MAISFVGSATGITSATLPTHEVGDLIVAFAFRDGSTTIPTLGSGFTSITTRTGTSSACRVGFRRATVTNTASGTWTNATSVVFVIYRDVLSIGSSSVSSGTSTTVTFPAVNLTNQTGSSWIVGFVGSSSTNVAIETAPSGMVNRTSVSDATDESAAHDTNSGLSTFTSRTASIGGTSGNWVSASIELIDGSATATATGIQASSSFASIVARVSISTTVSGEQLIADNLLIPTKAEWYEWYFGYRTVGFFANSNIIEDGVSVTSSFGTVVAIGEQNALTQINGITLNSAFGEVIAVGEQFAEIIVNGIELSSSFSEITAIGQQFAEIAITGIDLLANFENINANGFANIQLDAVLSNSEFDSITGSGFGVAESNSIELSSSIGSVAITIDDFESISGITIQTNFEPIVGIGGAATELDGLEILSTFGEVTAQSENAQNATILINGIELLSNNGTVTANSESPQTYAGGAIKRYPANQFVNATARPIFIQSNATAGNVYASGTNVISIIASVNSVELFTEFEPVMADGVLSISDEELIVLLAA